MFYFTKKAGDALFHAYKSRNDLPPDEDLVGAQPGRNATMAFADWMRNRYRLNAISVHAFKEGVGWRIDYDWN